MLCTPDNIFRIHISICPNKIYYNQFTYRWNGTCGDGKERQWEECEREKMLWRRNVDAQLFCLFDLVFSQSSFSTHIWPSHVHIVAYWRSHPNLSFRNVNFCLFGRCCEREHIEYCVYLCVVACNCLFLLFVRRSHFYSWLNVCSVPFQWRIFVCIIVFVWRLKLNDKAFGMRKWCVMLCFGWN